MVSEKVTWSQIVAAITAQLTNYEQRTEASCLLIFQVTINLGSGAKNTILMLFHTHVGICCCFEVLCQAAIGVESICQPRPTVNFTQEVWVRDTAVNAGYRSSAGLMEYATQAHSAEAYIVVV